MFATAFLKALADDITFTNKAVSFTNLQGQIYQHVQLVRGDLDGLIWRDKASGGRICYTNLHPDLLESFGISSNRIELARVRAEHKAIADARYRALAFAEAQATLRAQAALTNATATASVSASNGSAAYGPGGAYGGEAGHGSGIGYVPGVMCDPSFIYVPGFVYGPGVGSAPTAPSTRSAPSAPLAPSVPPAVLPPLTARPSH